MRSIYWLLITTASLGCGDETSGSGGSGGSSSAAMGSTAATQTTGQTVAATNSVSTGSRLTPPADLVRYELGDMTDADVPPLGPLLVVGGGGPDVDAAMQEFMTATNGGDVVVLRTSGADGYNAYLFDNFGGCDSVETMLVTSQALANDPYVAARLAEAEGIFIAGGDQSDYLVQWAGTLLEAELANAWSRNAALGGTSAGAAVLGSTVFAAHNGTVYSNEALADPFNRYMTLEYDFLALTPLAGVVIDTHFFERDRMGRLVGFVARAIADAAETSLLGLGIDEGTALVVTAAGTATVFGAGSVYALSDAGAPQLCSPGQPLEYTGLGLRTLSAGNIIQLPNGQTSVAATPLSASGGVTVPVNPY